MAALTARRFTCSVFWERRGAKAVSLVSASDKLIEYSHKLWDRGGAVTWDVPVGLDGKISPAFLDELSSLGKAAGTATH